jgi:hypothetical protein
VDLAFIVLAAIVLIAFRREIRALLPRLRKLEVGSLKVELDELQESTEKAAKETPVLESQDAQPLPPEPSPASTSAQSTAAEGATGSPKLAAVMLAAEIEKEVRTLVAVRGHLQGRRLLPLHQELEHLGVPPHLTAAVRKFWDVRSRLVHGYAASDDEAVRAVDLGLSILATIRSVPRETNIIYHPGVELFTDEAGRQPVRDERGVVLETTNADGTKKTHRVYPTTRADYVRGKQVSWEWNPGRTSGETWFKDPDSGAIKYAWRESMEFVGRHLEEI